MKKMKKGIVTLSVLMLLLSGCGTPSSEEISSLAASSSMAEEVSVVSEVSETEESVLEPESLASDELDDFLPGGSRGLVVIDPGHQAKGNAEKEPVGPGASEKKEKSIQRYPGINNRAV